MGENPQTTGDICRDLQKSSGDQLIAKEIQDQFTEDPNVEFSEEMRKEKISNLRLLEMLNKVDKSSKTLNKLTIILIVLTIILGVLAIISIFKKF